MPLYPPSTGGSSSWGGITGTLSAQTDLQTSLDLKAPLASPTFTGTVTVPDASFGLAKLANMATSSLIYRKTAGSGVPEVNTLATLKTDLALVKADVGLGSVDNTADTAKPVSTAQQTALDLKANLASPTFTGTVTLPTGSTSNAPSKFVSGTNLTSAVAGAQEYDGAQLYGTIDTSSGRAAYNAQQYFHLTAAGATISTIANYFGATSNISLVANAYYEIDIYLWFLNTTAGTVTWTLTNSAAPTGQNIYFEMSPLAGVQALPGSTAALTNLMIIGHGYNDATAAKAFTTGTLATAVNHYARFKIFLKNGAGTSLKIQATKNVGGTITPGINSYWFCRRLSPNNIGTFAA